MPVIVKPPGSNKLEDWVNQEDSVMEPPLMQALKKLVKFTGVTDPNSQIQELMNPMGVVGAPLVSFFKNKAARVAGTQLFRDTTKKMSGAAAVAGEQFAKDYPRVAAHIKPSTIPAGSGLSPGAHTQVLREQRRVPVRIRGGANVEDALNDLYHEGTHAAQALGNNKFDELYDEADKLLGYNDNPFEISAWDAGNRAGAFGKRVTKIEKPENAIRTLEGYAEDIGPTSKLAKLLAARKK